MEPSVLTNVNNQTEVGPFFSHTQSQRSNMCSSDSGVYTPLAEQTAQALWIYEICVINVLSKPGVNIQHQPELSRSPSLLLCTHSFTRIPPQSRWVSAFLVVQSGTDTRKSRDAAHQTQPPEHRSRQKSCVKKLKRKTSKLFEF